MTVQIGQIDSGFTIVDAEGLGQPVYDLLIGSWGSPDATGAGANSVLQWPPNNQPQMPFSLAGVAIGPTSDVDRVWLAFNRQKRTPVGVSVGLNAFLMRRCSLEAPLTFTQGSGPLNESVASSIASDPRTAMVNGLLYVFAAQDRNGVDPTLPIAFTFPYPASMDSTVWPSHYFDGFTGAARVFGFDAGLSPGSAANVFCPPQLHLQLFLKAPVVPQQRRFPRMWTLTDNVISNTDPQQIALIPIMGRERIRIMVSASGSGAQFTVGCIRNLNSDDTTVFETQHAQQSSTNGKPEFMTISDPCADYLVLYGAAISGIAPTNVKWSVTAYDGPGQLQGC